MRSWWVEQIEYNFIEFNSCSHIFVTTCRKWFKLWDKFWKHMRLLTYFFLKVGRLIVQDSCDLQCSVCHWKLHLKNCLTVPCMGVFLNNTQTFSIITATVLPVCIHVYENKTRSKPKQRAQTSSCLSIYNACSTQIVSTVVQEAIQWSKIQQIPNRNKQVLEQNVWSVIVF